MGEHHGYLWWYMEIQLARLLDATYLWLALAPVVPVLQCVKVLVVLYVLSTRFSRIRLVCLISTSISVSLSLAMVARESISTECRQLSVVRDAPARAPEKVWRAYCNYCTCSK